jgi:hypothetical protein
MALHVRYLLHKFGPRVLLLLPIRIKIGAQNIAFELQLPHAEPKDATGLIVRTARVVRIVAATAG